MKTAILICSCDAYSDCWEPMVYSIRKFWTDCPFSIYIVSNFIEKPINGVVFKKIGKHYGWASDTKKALMTIDADYIIYFQEDYFINKIVDTKSITEHLDYCEIANIDYLKISFDGINRDNYKIMNSIYCNNPIDIKYAVNTAVAIWKKNVFESLLIDGFTGWDFEYKILSHIKRNNIMISSLVIHSKYLSDKGVTLIAGNAVQRGKWTREGVLFLKSNGFEHLIKEREIQGVVTNFLISKWNNVFFNFPAAVLLWFFRKININL